MERACLRIAFALAGMTPIVDASCASAYAQTYPARNVRMLVPFAPGGGSDLYARTLGLALTKAWGRSVVIDNKGGAGGGLAAATAARAEPDGHTIFFATHPILTINSSLYAKLAYDAERDFAPVIKLGETALMLMVSASFSATTVPDLIKAAKSKAGSLNFGSGGVGTTQHLSAEMFKAMADIDLVHVPFKGGALASAAMMAGQIQLQFDSAYPGMLSMQSGKMRGLAVTSRNRLPMLPDIPAMNETLPGYESVLGYTIVAPAAIAPEILTALNRDLNKVLTEPAYKKEMESRAIYGDGGTPEELKAWLAAERKKWGELIRRLKLSVA